MQERMMKLGQKVQAAEKANKPQEALAAINQALTESPELEQVLGMYKLNLLARTNPAQATTYGNKLVDSTFKSNPQALNQVARTLVDPASPKKPSKAMAALSLKAATRADTITNGKNPAVADTLARAYFVNGNAAKAYETQQRAVTLSPGTPVEKDPGVPKRLAEYKKAAGK
jgi:tetratricopeptide (TPR) repeat protein